MRRGQAAYYGSLRAGDDDRDRAMKALQTAFADGRLDSDEFEERAGDVLHALTFAELERATADLPGGAGLTRYRPGGLVRTPRSGRALLCAGLGLGGWLGPTFVAWLPAIVLGHQARREIRRDGTAGRDLTTIGLAAAYAGMTMLLIAVVALVVTLTLV